MPDELFLENSLVIMGDEDVVLGFKALGFKVYAFNKSQGFDSAIDEVINNKTGICLIQDNIYRTLKEKIEDLRNLTLPIFLPFSKEEKIDLLDNIVKEIKIKATGVF